MSEMGKEVGEKKRVVVDTGPVVVVLEENENMAELSKTVYPMYPYGNSVRTHVTLEKSSEGKYTLSAGRTRLDWNGTGYDDFGEIELTEDEAKEIMDAMKSVKTEDDFERLKQKFFELKGKIEDEVEKEFSELVDEVMDVLLRGEMRETLKDEEKRKSLREYLLDRAYAYFEDC